MRTMVGLRFYNMDMVQYTKKAITILDQIQNLEDKGLKFFDVELAKDYMLSVGYFRLDCLYSANIKGRKSVEETTEGFTK